MKYLITILAMFFPTFALASTGNLAALFMYIGLGVCLTIAIVVVSLRKKDIWYLASAVLCVFGSAGTYLAPSFSSLREYSPFLYIIGVLVFVIATGFSRGRN